MKIMGINGSAGSGKSTLAQCFAATEIALADPLKRIAKECYQFTDNQLWGPSDERNKADLRYPRPHTWTEPSYEGGPVACLCCGVEVQQRAVEDDVWVPDDEDIETGNRIQCYLTPRYALQRLGTEYGRHCYPETWIQKLLWTANELEASNESAPLAYTPQLGLFGGLVHQPVSCITVPDVRFANEMEGLRRHPDTVLVRIRRPGAGLKGATALHASESEQLAIPDLLFDYVIHNTGTVEQFAQMGEVLVKLVQRDAHKVDIQRPIVLRPGGSAV